MFKLNEAICTHVKTEQKVVNYCGYNFIVPYHTQWMCVDEDGTIIASKNQPYIEFDENFWTIDDNNYEMLNYKILYEGDWKESLVRI